MLAAIVIEFEEIGVKQADEFDGGSRIYGVVLLVDDQHTLERITKRRSEVE